MRPRKLVLLVDADADRLGTRRLMLETQERLRVVPCASAEDAMTMLRGGLRVELLVTQWTLPGADGNELCAMASQLDPEMNRVILDAARDRTPPGCWAHRFLGCKASHRELLEVCALYARRKRGPNKTAAMRAAAAQAQAVSA